MKSCRQIQQVQTIERWQQNADIGTYIVAFEWKVGKGYVLNTTKLSGHLTDAMTTTVLIDNAHTSKS